MLFPTRWDFIDTGEQAQKRLLACVSGVDAARRVRLRFTTVPIVEIEGSRRHRPGGHRRPRLSELSGQTRRSGDRRA